MKMWQKFLMGIVGVLLLCSMAFAVDPYPYREPSNTPDGMEVIVLMGLVAQDGHKVLGVVDDKAGNYLLWIEVNGKCGAYFLKANPKEIWPMSCAQGLMVFENAVARGDCIDPREVPKAPLESTFDGFGIGGYGAFGNITNLFFYGADHVVEPD